MRRKVLALGVLIVLLATALAMLSYWTRDKIVLSDDSRLVKKEILNKIPIGSSIKQAQVIMENNGFTCSLINNNSFAADVHGAQAQKYHDNIDFLYCDKEKGWLFSKRWQVAVVHKGERVTEVLVSVGTIEP